MEIFIIENIMIDNFSVISNQKGPAQVGFRRLGLDENAG